MRYLIVADIRAVIEDLPDDTRVYVWVNIDGESICCDPSTIIDVLDENDPAVPSIHFNVE